MNRHVAFPLAAALIVSSCLSQGTGGAPAMVKTGQAAFTAADCSHDGKVSQAEARTIALIGNGGSPQPMTTAEFSAYDDDRDGYLNSNEVLDIFINKGVTGFVPAGSICPG